MLCPSGENCGSSIWRTAAKSSGFKRRFSAAKATDRESAKVKRAMMRDTVMGHLHDRLTARQQNRSNSRSLWRQVAQKAGPFGSLDVENGDKPPANTVD